MKKLLETQGMELIINKEMVLSQKNKADTQEAIIDKIEE